MLFTRGQTGLKLVLGTPVAAAIVVFALFPSAHVASAGTLARSTSIGLSGFNSCGALINYGERFASLVRQGSAVESGDPDIESSLTSQRDGDTTSPLDVTPLVAPVQVQEVPTPTVADDVVSSSTSDTSSTTGSGTTNTATAESQDSAVSPMNASTESSTTSSATIDSSSSTQTSSSSGSSTESTSASEPAATDDGGHSRTNVQEEGVDEPDIVKSDGSYMYSVSEGRLQAVDIRNDSPAYLGSLSLPGSGHELLLFGRRIYVASKVNDEKTLLAEVDISDPAKMRVVRTMTVEGRYVTSRLNGSTARFVVSSPVSGATLKEAVRSQSEREDWVPGGSLKTMRTGGRKAIGFPLADCDQVSKTKSFSGLGMLTILTVDLEQGLQTVDTDSLMTNAETVYASTGSMYVATRRWIRSAELPPKLTTEIHRFDISQPGVTEYRASGQISGFLLNQWSLSEHNGHLRVASTNAPDWWQGATSSTESSVTVLNTGSNTVAGSSGSKTLDVVGYVGGLGRGERIYSVRYMGDLGFIVTAPAVAARVDTCERTNCARPARRCPRPRVFNGREFCDPLYAIDLSNPQQPKSVGELKVSGYSTYLHPVGDGMLLGIGEDGTDDGRLLSRTQLSLFDISDPANLKQLHRHAIGELSTSEVEQDPHAFLYWAKKKLAILPARVTVGSWGATPQDVRGRFAGAIGFNLDRAGGIGETGRVAHYSYSSPKDNYPVRRAMVSGDRLITLSRIGVKVSDLTTLTDRGWVQFP